MCDLNYMHTFKPTLKIFLFHLTPPCFTDMDRSAEIYFFRLKISNWMSIKLNCIQ